MSTRSLFGRNRKLDRPFRTGFRRRLPPVGFHPYAAARVAVGSLLLAAAILKAYTLATQPLHGLSLFSSRLLLIGFIEMELLLGTILICGISQSLARRIALVFFAMFTCVSLYHAVSGADSCGCFGRIAINPWVTLAVDLVALGLLAFLRPRASEDVPATIPQSQGAVLHTRRVRASILVYLVLAAWSAWAIVTSAPTTFAGDDILERSGSVVLLEPSRWIGKRFPLLKYIDLGDRLASGRWLVILFHHDCPKCQERIAEYESLLIEPDREAKGRQVALIEMPPFATSKTQSAFLNPSHVHARLSGDWDWFATTPVEIKVDEGYVRDVMCEIDHP